MIDDMRNPISESERIYVYCETNSVSFRND